MKVIIVTGGRTFGIVPRRAVASELATARERAYQQANFLRSVLGSTHKASPVGLLIHGCAKGADALACEWAMVRGIHVLGFLADWDKHGRGAGPIRNGAMVKKAVELRDAGNEVVVIAFPGGTGTLNMLAQSLRAGLTVNDQCSFGCRLSACASGADCPHALRVQTVRMG